MSKALLVTQFFPPKIGGIEQYYNDFWQQNPHLLILTESEKFHGPSFTQAVEDRREKIQYQENDRIIRKKFFSGLIWPHWLPLLFNAYRITKKLRPEKIYVGEILPTGTVVWLIARLMKIPYVIFSHGMDLSAFKGSRRKEKLVKKILHSAKSFIVNSKFTQSQLMKFEISQNKIEVRYPAASVPDWALNIEPGQVPSENIKKILDFKNQGKKILLTLSRIVKRKGHDKVIASLPQVWQNQPNLIYVIAGEGPYAEKLKIKSNKVKEKIIFLGKVTNEEKWALLKLCDVFIMVPRDINGDVEGFGIVYLEAAKFGLPVIGSQTGGVPEAFKHLTNGILIDDPLDTRKIAETIILTV